VLLVCLLGYSCIVIAATYGYIDIIELLINFGADVEDKGRSRNPPIIAALEGGHLEVFEYLVDQIGADVNSTNCDENTCLHIAVNLKVESVSYQLQIIHSIIDRGINQTRVNRKGLTALQLALLNHNRIISQELGARFSDGDGEVILTEELLQNMPLSFTNTNVGEQANYLSMTTSSVMYKKTSETMINNLSKKITASSSQGNGCSTSIRANNESIVGRAKAASTITIDSRKSSIPLIQRTDLIQRTVDPMSSTVAPTRTVQKFTSKFRRQVAGEQVLPITNPLVAINPSSQLSKESVDNVIKAEKEQQMKDGNVTFDRLKAGGGKSIIDRNLNSIDHHHHDDDQLVGEEDGSLFTEVHMVDDKVVVLTNDAAAASTTNKLTTRNYKMKQVDKSVESNNNNNININNKVNNLVFSMDSIQLLEKGEGASMSSPPPDSSTPQAAVSASAADQKEHEVNNNSNISKKQQLFPRSSGRDFIGRLRVDDSLIDDGSMSIISGVTFDNQ
jgi:ankyrin repeat protein